MSRRDRHPGAWWVLLLVVLGIAAGGSEFRGCGGAEAPTADGGTLPVATGGCLVDSDCTSDDMCVLFRCAAGTCVEAGPVRDDDGDRVAPMPCGGDCDDSDSMVFPGAAERCDGVDQDCDGSIDEGAPGIRTETIEDEMADARIVGVADGYLIVGNVPGEPPAETLSAYVVRRDGTMVASATPVSTGAAPGLAPEAFALARHGDEVVVVMSGGPDAPPARVALTEAGGAWSAASAPTPLGAQTGATRLAVTVLGGQEWVLFDARAGGTGPRRRWLWRSDAPGSATELTVGADDPPPAIAHDGTRVVATEGASTLRFFDAEGADAGSQTLPGPFAAGALAPGDGFVYAVYRDAFDHTMTRATVEATTSPIAAPSGNIADRVSIFRAGSDVLVTRVDDVAAKAWLLEGDLSTYRTSFSSTDLSPIAGAPNVVTVATTDGGPSAILSSHPLSSSVAVLSCSPP